MSDPDASVVRTSPGRRLPAGFAGILAFLVCVMIAAALIGVTLGTGSPNLSAAGPAWLAAVFVGAWPGGARTGAGAPDVDAKTFFLTLVGVLALLAVSYAVGTGPSLDSRPRSATMVLGGVMGARKAIL